MKTGYLGLGSNIGNREANLREALERLESDGIRVVRRSSLYETEPRDLRDQPWFLTVSYTHLDVYKRQNQRRLRSALPRDAPQHSELVPIHEFE